MKTLTKKIVALMMVAAMMAMTAMTALAGTNTVKMFGLVGTDYVYSDHSGAMVDSVTDNGDGSYTVTFKKINMGRVTGYISQISTMDGREGELGPDGTTMTFTFEPAGEGFTGRYRQADRSFLDKDEVGTMITYTVELSSGTHSTSVGAIVIE